MDTRIESIEHPIVLEARKHIGTPFHHQGRVPGAGLDCIGLLVVVVQAMGIPIRDETDYSWQATANSGSHLVAELARLCNKVPFEQKQSGDIAVFWFDQNTKHPQHVGFLSSNGLIHTWTGVRKVVEHNLSSKWVDHLLAVYRLKEKSEWQP